MPYNVVTVAVKSLAFSQEKSLYWMISLIYGRSAPIPADNDDEDDATLGATYSSEDLTKSNETGAISAQTAGPTKSQSLPKLGLRE
jgi:hypothetical protein